MRTQTSYASFLLERNISASQKYPLLSLCRLFSASRKDKRTTANAVTIGLSLVADVSSLVLVARIPRLLTPWRVRCPTSQNLPSSLRPHSLEDDIPRLSRRSENKGRLCGAQGRTTNTYIHTLRIPRLTCPRSPPVNLAQYMYSSSSLGLPATTNTKIPTFLFHLGLRKT